MIASLALLAVRAGIPDRFAKAAVIAAGIIVLVLALGVGKCSYDRSVIAGHEAKQEASIARADRKADAKAATTRRADDARLTQETTELQKVQANAQTDTDRRLAKHRCLRAQQAARRDGKQPPACS